jgi:hypothetical protein
VRCRCAAASSPRSYLHCCAVPLCCAAAVLCCAVLCCAVLCCAVLCCAVLCFWLQYRALQCSGVSDSILAVKLSAIRALRARGVLPIDVFGVQKELQVCGREKVERVCGWVAGCICVGGWLYLCGCMGSGVWEEEADVASVYVDVSGCCFGCVGCWGTAVPPSPGCVCRARRATAPPRLSCRSRRRSWSKRTSTRAGGWRRCRCSMRWSAGCCRRTRFDPRPPPRPTLPRMPFLSPRPSPPPDPLAPHSAIISLSFSVVSGSRPPSCGPPPPYVETYDTGVRGCVFPCTCACPGVCWAVGLPAAVRAVHPTHHPQHL